MLLSGSLPLPSNTGNGEKVLGRAIGGATRHARQKTIPYAAYSLEKNCSEQEIIELCGITRQAGRFYATHTRNRQEQVEESIAEAIRAATASGVPLQISHISSVSRLTGRSRWAVERSTFRHSRWTWKRWIWERK